MHRRLALAFSLAFTTVVTFGVIAVGAQIGVFSAGHSGASAQVAPPAPTNAPLPPPTEAPVEPTPIVVTQYDYIDVPDPAPTHVAPAAAPSATVVAATSTAAATSAAVHGDAPPAYAPPAVPNPAPAPAYPVEHEDSPSGGSGGHDD